MKIHGNGIATGWGKRQENCVVYDEILILASADGD